VDQPPLLERGDELGILVKSSPFRSPSREFGFAAIRFNVDEVVSSRKEELEILKWRP
jgi:hypothetical protein